MNPTNPTPAPTAAAPAITLDPTAELTGLKALVEKFKAAHGGKAHLLNTLGALRQAAHCLENHIAAEKAEKK